MVVSWCHDPQWLDSETVFTGAAKDDPWQKFDWVSLPLPYKYTQQIWDNDGIWSLCFAAPELCVCPVKHLCVQSLGFI